MSAPHWFAVTRLSDNRLSGLMREIAELIDSETDAGTLSDLRISLQTLASGAHCKAWHLSKGRVR
jgi:hypothetical protein